MGCDIHMYLECESLPASERTGSAHYGCMIQNAGNRDYSLFGWLAGVRCEPPTVLFPPRGLPDALSYDVEAAVFLLVDDNHSHLDGYCSTTQAAQWGGVVETDPNTGLPARVLAPDWHSYSWLTIEEYRTVLAAYTLAEGGPPGPEYTAVLAAGEALEARGYPARVVFWFDN